MRSQQKFLSNNQRVPGKRNSGGQSDFLKDVVLLKAELRRKQRLQKAQTA
jgi:hypothetical protein